MAPAKSLSPPLKAPARHIAEAAGLNPVAVLQLCGALPIPHRCPQMLYTRLLLEAMDDDALDVVAAQVRVICQGPPRKPSS